jgi:hypothetical protein
VDQLRHRGPSHFPICVDWHHGPRTSAWDALWHRLLTNLQTKPDARDQLPRPGTTQTAAQGCEGVIDAEVADESNHSQ